MSEFLIHKESTAFGGTKQCPEKGTESVAAYLCGDRKGNWMAPVVELRTNCDDEEHNVFIELSILEEICRKARQALNTFKGKVS